MIVVLGRPAASGSEDGEAAGLAVGIARSIAARGEPVELVGSVGDDAAGDAIIVALGRAGVGHAALLRDPAAVTPRLAGEGRIGAPTGPLPRLDAADVGLAMRYLLDCRVVVLADDLDAAARAAALEGAAFHGATVVAIERHAGAVPHGPEARDGHEAPVVLRATEPEAGPGPATGWAAFVERVADLAVRSSRGAPAEATRSLPLATPAPESTAG